MNKLTRKQLAETITRLIQEENTEHLAAEVAEYLVQEHRTNELNSLMRDVAKIRAERYGVMEATATTAYALNAELKREIANFLNADNLILNEQQDPKVVGGVQLEALDLQLDATVHDRLRTLKQLVKET